MYGLNIRKHGIHSFSQKGLHTVHDLLLRIHSILYSNRCITSEVILVILNIFDNFESLLFSKSQSELRCDMVVSDQSYFVIHNLGQSYLFLFVFRREHIEELFCVVNDLISTRPHEPSHYWQRWYSPYSWRMMVWTLSSCSVWMIKQMGFVLCYAGKINTEGRVMWSLLKNNRR